MAGSIPANLTAPIFTFDVESGGQFQDETRMILIGFGDEDGWLGEGQISVCNSKTDARNLVGAGTMLEAMFLNARANAPAQEIWIGRPAEVGNAEVRTITIGSVPAAGGQGVLQVAGETLSLQVDPGDTAANVAAALAAAINGYYNPLNFMSLPFTATVATTVVTLTARHKGAYAGKLDLFVPVLDTVNIFDGLLTFATTVAGTGAPDLSAVLAAMHEDPFEIIVSAFGDSLNLGRLDTFLNNISGRWSYAQQLYGHAFFPAEDTSSNLVTMANAHDTWHLTAIPRFSGGGNGSPDYLWVTGFVARVAAWFGGGSNGDVSRNQSGLVVQGVLAPRDRDYWMDYPTRDVLLKNGLSTWTINRNGDVAIDKIITMVQTINGAPDTTFRDIQSVYQTTYALKKLRADLATEHSNKALAQDNPANLDAITTPKDIKATLFHSYQSMPGVLKNAAAVLPYIVVAIDSDNPDRVNFQLPLDRVNALDILAGLARVYSQFTSSAAAAA
jgi:phage tail sheath gpL-like